MKARIKFSKYGSLRFIGHLDVMRYFQKVMRRAEIPIAFTGGFSPHMIMSFASPLGIGLESDGEYLDIELTEPVDSLTAVRRMNENSTEGIEILSFRQIAEEKKMTGMTILSAADYLISPDRCCSELFLRDWRTKFTDFMAQKEIRVMKQTKRSEKEVDLRPMIYCCEFRGESVFVKTAAGSSENLKPDLIMHAFLESLWPECRNIHFHYRRLEMYAKIDDRLISLEDLGSEIST